ncbi:fungal-specific transcription factor domain-containing protein [Pseudomassariella vexata]|uniref:Fungal-specific transcription factor domain-domain-containing protein n=1 Tax=Pseudomassariella vexata TaxID=1141098 RepID=A0A1Y2EGD4_9PEZI|nr:fungal-specific transcription factor domain-containing protein [Pseudomassariella vexata]ORY70364.1 fungal-specific transcription factor domain-domain-containing protein [Pseudomassariella vexata]
MPSEPGPKMGLKRQSSHQEDKSKPEPAAAPKRQRVSRACDQCRAAREKCDGLQPLCFPCASQNRHCTWEEPKKKRGVQTGYIRTLELALGWIFDKIPGSENALHSLLTHEGGQGRSLLLEKDTQAGNRLHRRWRRSTIHKEIDRVLSGADATEAKADKTSPASDDVDSADDGEKPLHANSKMPVLAVDLASISTGKPTPDSERLEQNVTDAPDEASHPSPILRDDTLAISPRSMHLRLPVNYWRLLDIYFSYTHCWFPILEKPRVQKTSWRYPNEGLGISSDHPESGAHAELWAALALASYQDEASHPNNERPRERCSPGEMYRLARNLIPPEEGCFDVRHVNALLLLTLVKFGHQNLEAAWILVGLAARINLRLGLDAAPVTDSSRRSHAYMGCFILDTLTSARLNRPPHLRFDDTQSPIPSGENEQDEWESWAPCAGFGPKQQVMLARSPSHTVSSFSSLYRIHQFLSRSLFSAKSRILPTDESYLIQIQRSIGRGPFSAFVINGGVPPTRIPSVYILRIASLFAGDGLQVFPESLPGIVLQCLEEYISSFGACGTPPLFPTYIALINCHYNLDKLTPQDRDRWNKVEGAIRSVWAANRTPLASGSTMNANIRPRPSSISQSSQPNPDFPRNTDTAMRQFPNPASYYGDASAEQSTFHLNADLYAPTPATSILSYTNNHPHQQSLNSATHDLNPSSSYLSGTAFFGPMDVSLPSQSHGPAHHTRHSFSAGSNATTFDYDAMLDDIAAIDRTDSMGESDPQFMANLGFAPGSNIADVLTHDFIGYS